MFQEVSVFVHVSRCLSEPPPGPAAKRSVFHRQDLAARVVQLSHAGGRLLEASFWCFGCFFFLWENLPGVIKWEQFYWDPNKCKYMVNLRDFPFCNALNDLTRPPILGWSLHSGRLTWNLRIHPWRRGYVIVPCKVHVNLSYFFSHLHFP